jgi:hypothetical protein
MLSALVKRIGGKPYSLDQQLDFIGGYPLSKIVSTVTLCGAPAS